MPGAPTCGPVHLQTADPPVPAQLLFFASPDQPPSSMSPVHLGPSTWAAFSWLVMFPCSLAPPGLLCAQKHLHLPSLWGCHGGIKGLPSDQAMLLRSLSRHPQRTSWARSAEKSRRRPSHWSGSSCTTAGWCPSSVPSPTLRSGGRSECCRCYPCPGPPHIPPRGTGLVTGWGWSWGRSGRPRQQKSS